MAYFVGNMVSGLCLYSAWRKPERKGKTANQYFGGVDAYWILAWRGMELYFVGIVFCGIFNRRKVVSAQEIGKVTVSRTHLHAVFGDDKFCNI